MQPVPGVGWTSPFFSGPDFPFDGDVGAFNPGVVLTSPDVDAAAKALGRALPALVDVLDAVSASVVHRLPDGAAVRLNTRGAVTTAAADDLVRTVAVAAAQAGVTGELVALAPGVVLGEIGEPLPDLTPLRTSGDAPMAWYLARPYTEPGPDGRPSTTSAFLTDDGDWTTDRAAALARPIDRGRHPWDALGATDLALAQRWRHDPAVDPRDPPAWVARPRITG